MIPGRADLYALSSQIGPHLPSCTSRASSYPHLENLSPDALPYTTLSENVIYLKIKDKVGNLRFDKSGKICWDGTCRFYTGNLRLPAPISGP